MISHEQTAIRRCENENRTLRAENEKLTQKIKDIKNGVADLIENIAPRLHSSYRNDVINMAKELRE